MLIKLRTYYGKKGIGENAMIELKLNDFEGFNKILFGDHKPDWSKFYDATNDTFLPPYPTPKTEVEHQVCHYALWMVISTFSLIMKPIFLSDVEIPVGRCYACQYKHYHVSPEYYCKDGCPLVLDDDYDFCGSAYNEYELASDNFGMEVQLKDAAERVAKLEWREVGDSSSAYLNPSQKLPSVALT